MTTIAFDGKTLAADKAGWKNSYTWSKVTKVYRVVVCKDAAIRLSMPAGTEVVVAFAGVAGDIGIILNWMQDGGDVPVLETRDISRGIIVVVDKASELPAPIVMTLTSNLTTEPPYEAFPVADGGGFDMVMGAMLAGASAVDAMRLVASRSSWAAGGITAYDLTADKITEYEL